MTQPQRLPSIQTSRQPRLRTTRLSHGLAFNLYSSSRKRKEKIGFKRQTEWRVELLEGKKKLSELFQYVLFSVRGSD
jgi:hypothetical protein